MNQATPSLKWIVIHLNSHPKINQIESNLPMISVEYIKSTDNIWCSFERKNASFNFRYNKTAEVDSSYPEIKDAEEIYNRFA